MGQVIQYLIQCINSLFTAFNDVKGELLLVLAISFPGALIWQLMENRKKTRKKKAAKAARRMRRLTK